MDNNVNYEENRFGYLREHMDELESIKQALEQEIDEYYDDLNNDSIGSEQKSEIRNSDLPYTQEKLNYINDLLSKEESKSI